MARTGRLLVALVSVAGCTPGNGGGADMNVMVAPFGLDERPANATCVAPPRPAVMPLGVTLERAFAPLAFSQPVLVAQAPGDAARFFVVEKQGFVKVFPAAGPLTAATFVDISARVSAGPNEGGLLGLAFHPQFATNGQVFLSYTGFGGPTNFRSKISRFTSRDNGLTLDPSSEDLVLSIDQPYQNHNGGNILFGPDGFLYAGYGAGGSGGDPRGSGQDTSVLLGKMLRLDVDGARPYANPPGNPFVAGGGRPEIFAWGLRNPWRWSFDRGTGELWVGDVGQDDWEEIDKVVLGGNYGWNTREGKHCYGAGSCNTTGLVDPVIDYDRGGGSCVTGGFVYRGTAIPSLVGTYVYGDFSSGRIWALTFDPMTGASQAQQLTDTGYNISSFGEGVDGELYVVDYYGGTIQRLVPSGSMGTGGFPDRLSKTGCVDPSDATRPAPGLIPYDLNSPLWSDGADKRRWLALPASGKIHVNSDGDWDLPIGTVAIKEFSLAGKRVETRLLVRHSDGGWAGYSYAWDDAEKDATLLPAGLTKVVGGQTWTFPSRAECLQCHTGAAGRTIGLETAQLNRDLVYPGGRLSGQLATLDHIGLFDVALPAPSTLPALPVPTTGAQPLESRARAYLHANCAHCHRPGGAGQGTADFRHDTAWASAGVCNALPQAGDLGVTGARLVVPGNAAQSLVSLRTHALDANRMPPLGSSRVDVAGVAVIDGWIGALTNCN